MSDEAGMIEIWRSFISEDSVGVESASSVEYYSTSVTEIETMNGEIILEPDYTIHGPLRRVSLVARQIRGHE